MRKESARDELRPRYDLSQLKGEVRGKYYRQAVGGTNLVLIEPDLARVFPNEKAVNGALRLLVSTANAATRLSRTTARNNRHKRSTARRTRSMASG